jgi:hypothetical protein
MGRGRGVRDENVRGKFLDFIVLVSITQISKRFLDFGI